MHLEYYFCHIALITLVGILTKEFSHALRDVRVTVPAAVRRGEQAALKCYYDIEDDSLYSVKWYKGRREFYRYTPKENPAMKIFQFQGVKVERYSSNESQLVLQSVTMATSGKYSCEVSADAPSFHTLIAAAELEVVEPPHNAPFIAGIRSRYRIGDILRGNCTSRHSKPAANLTWTLNNEEVHSPHVRHYKVLRDVRNDMETAIVGIHFVVTAQHFESGKLRLRCSAEIHDIYWKFTERAILEADLHQHNFNEHKNGGIDINMVQPDHDEVEDDEETPYDKYVLNGGEMLRKKDDNSFITRIQDYLYQFMRTGSHGEEDAEDAAWAVKNAAHMLTAPQRTTALLLCLQLGWQLAT